MRAPVASANVFIAHMTPVGKTGPTALQPNVADGCRAIAEQSHESSADRLILLLRYTMGVDIGWTREGQLFRYGDLPADQRRIRQHAIDPFLDKVGHPISLARPQLDARVLPDETRKCREHDEGARAFTACKRVATRSTTGAEAALGLIEIGRELHATTSRRRRR